MDDPPLPHTTIIRNNYLANLLPTVIAANVDATSSAGENACYIHQALCSPPATTLIQVLKCSRELATIPGLTAHLINTHLPYSTATDKGHMRHHQQGIQSIQTMQPAIVQARCDVDSLQPSREICAAHDRFCFVALANLNTGTMYTDLPGAFPVRSFKSMQYISVAYIYDLNAILVRAMPSKNNTTMITAFTKILATLAAHGYKPTLNVTDNECSKTVEAYIKSNKMDIHLVPPHNHGVNATERAITTFKEHFITGLATVDKNCPLQLWDEFLHQVKLTLNLLCFSCRDPRKSVNKEVHGPYDFNKTPIAPIGEKGLVYDDPAVRASWAPHGTDAFYMGPTPKQYQCLQFYMPTTQRCCIVDTWHLYPSNCTYQLSQPLISRSSRHAMCSGHYKTPSQHQPAKPPPEIWLSVTYVPSSIQPYPPAP
jgi:hypothetical protein